MSSNHQLKTYFSRLRDEEVLSQLIDDRLTDEASILAREELASRGICVDTELTNRRAQREQAANRARDQQHNRTRLLLRLARFPIRSLIGVESPWSVLAVGILTSYALQEILVVIVTGLVFQRPLPGYALPLAYAALAVFYAFNVWLSVSLWRCSHRSKLTHVVWLMRAIGTCVAIGIVISAFNVIPLIQQGAGVI
jgi:hypothetical protein